MFAEEKEVILQQHLDLVQDDPLSIDQAQLIKAKIQRTHVRNKKTPEVSSPNRRYNKSQLYQSTQP